MKRLITALIIGLIIASCLSLMAGKIWISPLDIASNGEASIIYELRLPRTILGIIVGAALGMAGAAMQGFLRNPLADPGLFGISRALCGRRPWHR